MIGLFPSLPSDHSPVVEIEALLLNNDQPFLSVDQSMMKSMRNGVSACIAVLAGSAALCAFHLFFRHMDDIILGTNRLITLSQRFSVQRNELGISFKSFKRHQNFQWMDYYSGPTCHDRKTDGLGIGLIVAVISSYVVPPIFSLLLMLVNLDPLLHAVLYLSSNLDIFNKVILLISKIIGSPIRFKQGFFMCRLITGSFGLHELMRIGIVSSTIGILWGVMYNRNAFIAMKVAEYAVSIGRQEHLSHIRLHRQLMLCINLLKDANSELAFLLCSMASFAIILCNFAIIHSAKHLPFGITGIVVYASLTMITVLISILSLITKFNGQAVNISRVMTMGASQLRGFKRKLVVREILGIPHCLIGLSVLGHFLGNFTKFTKIIVVRVIFESTLNVLITFK